MPNLLYLALVAGTWLAALERIYGAAQDVDQKRMTPQYFVTLKDMGASPATKFIFPIEFTRLLDSFNRGGNSS